MALDFLSLPANLKIPGVFVDTDVTRLADAQGSKRVLVIGQRTSAGTVAAAIETRVRSAAAAVTFFGAGSQLARMFAKIFANTKAQLLELYAVALDDDGSGVPATGTIQVTSPATADGTIYLYVGGVLVTVAVASGDSANDIAAAIEAALDAAVADLAVTASVTTDTVTLTAKNDGLAGNTIDIRVNYLTASGGEELPAGVALSITQMASGATDPDVTAALTAIAGKRFHHIIHPYTHTTNWDAIDADLVDRWGPMEALYGQAWTAYEAANVSALGTFGDGLNEWRSSCVGYINGLNPVDEWAAAYGALAAAQLIDDQTRPVRGTLVGIKAPALADRPTKTENNGLIDDGMSIWTVDASGNVVLQLSVTTYQVNAASEEDDSLQDTTTPAAITELNDRTTARLEARFNRHKIVADSTRVAAGQAVASVNMVKSEVLAVYREAERDGIVENLDAYKELLAVNVHDSIPTRMEVLSIPDLVSPLHQIAILQQPRLQLP